MPRLPRWIREVVFRRRVERELQEEMRFHLEREEDHLVELGLCTREAHRRARAAFGGVDAIVEECREGRATYVVETFVRDVRYAARVLRRSPGFTLTAVMTLALSIGAISSLLTLTHTFFLRPLPIPRPAEVVEVQATRDNGTNAGLVSYPDYVRFRDAGRAVRSLAAVYSTAPLFVEVHDQARQVNGYVVSANFFPMLELEPALGRFFRPDEDAVPGRDRVVVLGHDFWRVEYGASVDVLGATLHINGESFTIIGVGPSAFPGISTQAAAIYLPTMMLGVGYRACDALADENCTILRMLGRLDDGVTVATAAAEAATLAPASWADAGPGDNSGATAVAVRGVTRSATDDQFISLLAVVGGVLLLVCCANLAGLLIARGSERAGELAIRTSLGAPAGRLARQLVSESLLVALVGGAGGVAVSTALTGALGNMFFTVDYSGRPLRFDFGVEPIVVAAVILLSLAAGLLFGIAPALISVRRGANAGLRKQSTAVTHRLGAGRLLLGSQAAVAVALVVVASLLSTSATTLVAGINYEPAKVALLRLRPRLVQYSPERAQRYLRDVTARLAAMPGVDAVSMVGTGISLIGFSAEVALPDPATATRTAGYIEVGPRYFETLGTPVLRGREFTPGDDVDAPAVAVVSAGLADALWPEGDALGAVVMVNAAPHTVVGMVADAGLQSRADPPRPYVFTPFWQNPDHVDARLQVRVSGDPGAMLPDLSREILRVDPAVPVTETLTLDTRMAGLFRGLRMSATGVAYAAGLAVVLSAVGLYASLASAVARRTREMGLRRALGATADGVLALVIRQGMGVVVAGVIAGLALGFSSTRLLEHLLYGSSRADGLFFAAAAAGVIAVALVACWVPARRAARIEPMVALRQD